MHNYEGMGVDFNLWEGTIFEKIFPKAQKEKTLVYQCGLTKTGTYAQYFSRLPGRHGAN